MYPESGLKKKHHSAAYHMCREAVASGMVRVTKEDTRSNIANLFTSGPRRENLIDVFMCCDFPPNKDPVSREFFV